MFSLTELDGTLNKKKDLTFRSSLKVKSFFLYDATTRIPPNEVSAAPKIHRIFVCVQIRLRKTIFMIKEKRQRPDLNREILAETRFPVLRSTRLSHVGIIIVLEQ